jgi:transmembrane sensor
VKYQTNFIVEDLLQNESFLNFYFRKNEADIFEWEEWSEDNLDRLKLVSQAFVALDQLSLKWSENEIKSRFAELGYDIQANTPANSKILQFKNYRWLAAASMVFLLGISAVWWYGVNQSSASIYQELVSKSSVQLIEKTNLNPKPLLITLNDGSSVLLQKNSRLSYPQIFDAATREVYLEGEALFEVAKNVEQPFFVYANELVTKVLGTSFVVKAYPNQNSVEVLVKTGKVSVYRLAVAKAKKNIESKELDGVVITPNQQIVYERADAEFKKFIVEKPIELKSQPYEFKNESVANILKTIQQTYGIVIVFDEAILSNCPLTASLSDEPLYGKLDLICRAIGADYQVIDGQIVINSKGCN